MHAHPADEAVFIGLVLRRLADRGSRVVLVTATAGEAAVRASGPEPLAVRGVRELEESCAHLGVARLVLYGRRDSGLPGALQGWHPPSAPTCTGGRALGGTRGGGRRTRVSGRPGTEVGLVVTGTDSETATKWAAHGRAHQSGRVRCSGGRPVRRLLRAVVVPLAHRLPVLAGLLADAANLNLIPVERTSRAHR